MSRKEAPGQSIHEILVGQEFRPFAPEFTWVGENPSDGFTSYEAGVKLLGNSFPLEFLFQVSRLDADSHPAFVPSHADVGYSLTGAGQFEQGDDSEVINFGDFEGYSHAPLELMVSGEVISHPLSEAEKETLKRLHLRLFFPHNRGAFEASTQDIYTELDDEIGPRSYFFLDYFYPLRFGPINYPQERFNRPGLKINLPSDFDYLSGIIGSFVEHSPRASVFSFQPTS